MEERHLVSALLEKKVVRDTIRGFFSNKPLKYGGFFKQGFWRKVYLKNPFIGAVYYVFNLYINKSIW